MSDAIDLKDARRRFCKEHSTEAYLNSIGVEIIGKGKNAKAKCPLHEDRNPSFSVNLNDGSWQCFVGCGKGGVVELMALHKGKSVDVMLSEFAALNGNGKTLHATAPPVNWNECVQEFGEAHRARLMEWRGFSEKFVNHLVERKMIGICEGNLAFPIYAAGKVIGTHQRLKKGGWITRGGTGSPWVIGGGHFENVLIFESQWDAFALMDAVDWFDTSISALCSIVITRGAARGKEIKNMFPVKGKLIVWMQNDEPDPKTGLKAADKWLSDIISVLHRVHVCRPPKEWKDLNDWRKDGFAGSDEIIALMEASETYRDPTLPQLPPPMDLRKMMDFNPADDSECLIGNRYLCRGGSAIWIGGSGLGKSVMILQAAIQFALGESMLGLEPKRPLKSIILSAEDDFGDLSETLQGVMRGMGIGKSDPRFNQVMESVLLYQETTLKGLSLIGYAEQLVIEHKADLLWLNPLMQYFSGNPSDPEKSSEFTGALSNMQFSTKVCTMLVHHTGKPKDSETTKAWSIDDFSYIGLGSSVWTNWARAVLVLQAMKRPKGVFVLRFAKRGQRAGVVSEQGEKVREIYIEHADKGLRWVASDFCPSDDENETGGRPSKASWAKVYDAWDGMDKTHRELKDILMEVLSISDKTAGRVILKWSGVYIFKNTKDLWTKGGQ